MYMKHALFTRKGAVVLQFPPVELLRGERAMQIDCPECSGKAIIYSRKKLDPKVSTLYCACKSEDCRHLFVMDLSYSHSTSPSQLQKKNTAIEYLRALPEEERQQVLSYC